MSFRWAAAIALWTMLSAPVLNGPGIRRQQTHPDQGPMAAIAVPPVERADPATDSTLSRLGTFYLDERHR